MSWIFSSDRMRNVLLSSSGLMSTCGCAITRQRKIWWKASCRRLNLAVRMITVWGGGASKNWNVHARRQWVSWKRLAGASVSDIVWQWLVLIVVVCRHSVHNGVTLSNCHQSSIRSQKNDTKFLHCWQISECIINLVLEIWKIWILFDTEVLHCKNSTLW